MKQCLHVQSVNHEQFPIQMTQNNKHNKVAGNPPTAFKRHQADFP